MAYIGVGGTARKISKCYVGVNTLQSVGALPVGTVVKLKVNGKATDFIVVHQGNPDAAIYDSSCDGTWLLMKGGYEHQQWAAAYNNDYKTSNLHSYLNNDFFSLLDSGVQAIVKQVKIPYVGLDGDPQFADYYGANGLSAKVFALSCKEIGETATVSYYLKGEGALLDYFLAGKEAEASALRYAEWSMGSGAVDYWTRSIYNSTYVHYILNYNTASAGNADRTGMKNTATVRPAMILPSSAGIKNGIVDGSSAAYGQVARRIKKAYIGVDGVARLVWKE